MIDIVERLRLNVKWKTFAHPVTLGEAADKIEELEGRTEELKKDYDKLLKDGRPEDLGCQRATDDVFDCEDHHNLSGLARGVDFEDIDISPVYATLHFYYDDPDSMERFKQCNEARDVLLAVGDFERWLKDSRDWEGVTLCSVRDKLFQFFDDYGVRVPGCE